MKNMKSNSIKHILVAPAIAIFVIVTIFPLLFNVFMSFSNWQLGGEIDFVGFNNYVNVFENKIFWKTVYNTVIILVISVFAEYCIAMVLAYNINKMLRGKKIIRVAMLLPMLMAPVVIGFMWKQLFNESFGPLNYFLSLFGIDGIRWISQKGWSLFSIILVDIWEWTPFVILILLAGFQSLPKEPLESARVDGASAWRIFWDHIFKMLIPYSLVAITLRSIETFKIFDTVYIITAGGPGVSSMSASMYAYQVGLRNFNLGSAAAMCVILMIMLLGTFKILTKIQSKKKGKIISAETLANAESDSISESETPNA